MTDEEWTARLRAFDRCREAHAHTLDGFRAQVEAARRTLRRVILRLEAERSGLDLPAGTQPREFTADGERWSVRETAPARPAAFVDARPPQAPDSDL